MSTTTKEKRAKRRRRFGRIVSRKWPSGRRTFMTVWSCHVMRKRLTRSFDSEKEARDFLDELERRKITDTYTPPPTHAEADRTQAAAVAESLPVEIPTFIDYAETVIDRRFAAVLARGTLGVYRASLRAWRARLGPRDGRPALRIDEVTPAVWADYRAWRAGTRNSPSGTATSVGPRTLNADQQCAVRILNEAVTDGHLARNPLAGLRKLREARRPRRYLTKAEILQLINAASWRFRPLVVAAVTTGARKSELLRLRWCDISEEQGKIAVFRSKTGSSDWLDLHPMLAEELRVLRARLKKKELPTGPADPVFRSLRGTGYTNPAKAWAAAVEAAGLSGRAGLTFHALRHSFATHFLEGGGAVTDLQAQLGHAELATTQIYAAAVSERRRAAVMGMDFGTAASSLSEYPSRRSDAVARQAAGLFTTPSRGPAAEACCAVRPSAGARPCRD